MKVAILCTYPPRLVTNDFMIGSKKTHVSPWNVNLIDSLSRINDLSIYVLGNGTFLKSKIYIKNNITFIYISKVPFIDKYFPNIRKRRFQKYIDKFNPDIVHGIGNEHLFPYFALKSGYKNVLTFHGILKNIISNPSVKDQIRLKIEDYVFNNMSNVICISSVIRNYIKNNNYNVKAHNINNAINNNFFNSKYLNNNKEFDLIMVGMIYPLKNTHLIVPVVKNLKKTNKDIKVAILGGPIPKYKKYYNEILDNIKLHNLESNIILIGQKENFEVPDYISKSKILLHLSKQETAGMVFVESLALNTYVVTNNVGNIDELKSKYNGIFILEKLNTDYISKKIYENLILINKDKINNVNIHEIKNNYSANNIAKKTYNVYKKIYLDD